MRKEDIKKALEKCHYAWYNSSPYPYDDEHRSMLNKIRDGEIDLSEALAATFGDGGAGVDAGSEHFASFYEMAKKIGYANKGLARLFRDSDATMEYASQLGILLHCTEPSLLDSTMGFREEGIIPPYMMFAKEKDPDFKVSSYDFSGISDIGAGAFFNQWFEVLEFDSALEDIQGGAFSNNPLKQITFNSNPELHRGAFASNDSGDLEVMMPPEMFADYRERDLHSIFGANRAIKLYDSSTGEEFIAQ